MPVLAYLLGSLLYFALAQDDLARTSLPFPPLPVKKEEISPKFWENQARAEIKLANKQFCRRFKPKNPVKNIILFLADGMGLPTIAATRFDQSEGTGQPNFHPYEDFEFSTLVRTYDLEAMVSDSAASATAYLMGVKTRTNMVGLTGDVNLGECRAYSEEERPQSALTSAFLAGKRTGVVTTARVTHASPAGCYGHAGHRLWESDADMRCNGGECGCNDLAFQLIRQHSYINVILGGGQQNFYPNTSDLPSDKSQRGKRRDGLNLVDDWIRIQGVLKRKFKYIDRPEAFFGITNFSSYDYVLSLTSPSHIPFELDKKSNIPGLYNLTMAALSVLEKSPTGYFLFVEGAHIDEAHHLNLAKHAFAETHAIDYTIKAVLDKVNISETLVIVTADHSHSFELIGQQSRQRSLFSPDVIKGNQTLDGKGMLPIGYITGPQGYINRTRDVFFNKSEKELESPDFRPETFISTFRASHGGDDVGVFATGPFSYLFHHTIDNTFISYAMRYAMCAPPFTDAPFCASCSSNFPHSPAIALFLLLITF